MQRTREICLHLEKLDKLPLDQRFDFRKYLDGQEFLYIGELRLGSNPQA